MSRRHPIADVLDVRACFYLDVALHSWRTELRRTTTLDEETLAELLTGVAPPKRRSPPTSRRSRLKTILQLGSPG